MHIKSMYLLEILKLAFIDLSAELKYFPASDCALNTNWRLSVKNEESNRNTRRGLITYRLSSLGLLCARVY